MMLRVEDNVTLQVEDKEIEPSNTERLRGCLIQQDMNWNMQIGQGVKSMMGRIRRKFAEVRRVTRGLGREDVRQVVNGVLMSVMRYGEAVWGGTNDTNLWILQRLKNKMARFVLQDGKRTRIKVLLEKCSWMSVIQNIYHTTLDVEGGEKETYWILE